MINSDANSLGVSLAKTSSLEFLDGESLAGPDLDVVFVGGTVNNWPQLPQRSGSDPGRLGDPGPPAADLPGRLVEPGLHIVLPVLVKVTIWYDVVSFRWHFFWNITLLFTI